MKCRNDATLAVCHQYRNAICGLNAQQQPRLIQSSDRRPSTAPRGPAFLTAGDSNNLRVYMAQGSQSCRGIAGVACASAQPIAETVARSVICRRKPRIQFPSSALAHCKPCSVHLVAVLNPCRRQLFFSQTRNRQPPNPCPTSAWLRSLRRRSSRASASSAAAS